MKAPFHRLLSFYSNRSPYPDTQTITLGDSLRGNLALGIDFPVALGLAVARAVALRNMGWFSLQIHVPSMSTKVTILDGVAIDEKKQYTRSELVSAVRPKGIMPQLDAFGLWALACSNATGRIAGENVKSVQDGTLLDNVERRRKGREEVLPFIRGGPISVAGHSWFVGKIFGVDVYRADNKSD